MPQRAGAKDGDATRSLLVETAERLFAEHDIGSVSIRQVNKEAGVSAAAIHYHFGSKDALVDAVVRRLGEPVVAEFLAGARELLAQRRQPTARDLLNVWAAPIFRVLDEDRERAARWLKVTAHLSGSESGRLWGPDVAELWPKVLERAFPDATTADRLRGWVMVSVAMPHLLARAPSGDDQRARTERERYIDGCLEFATKGLRGYISSVSVPDPVPA
jgi:AcrR family transcriptional regulator